MSEPITPTHVLLRQMKCTDGTVCDNAFETLVYRFRGPFERYAREKLGNDDAPLATDDTFIKIYRSRKAFDEKKCTCKYEFVEQYRRFTDNDHSQDSVLT